MVNVRYHPFWVYLRGPQQGRPPAASQALAIPVHRAAGRQAVRPARRPGRLSVLHLSKLGSGNLAGKGEASLISASRWPINVLLMSKLAFLSFTPFIFYCSCDVLKAYYSFCLLTILFFAPGSLLLREFLCSQSWFFLDFHEMQKLHASWIPKNHLWKCSKAFKAHVLRNNNCE